MCLYVKTSHVKDPLYEIECVKQLTVNKRGYFVTKYLQSVLQPGTGWFMPKYSRKSKRTREFRLKETIHEGFIHAYRIDEKATYADPYRNVRETLPKHPRRYRTYTFKAYARDVVAVGTEGDLVCKALYIPAFDITETHRNATLVYK